ncbi:hypothetical protein NQ318_006868 [Aromia moschata]|uniref:Uncharacterized protein n=1 Tax=Aromia moschata TaxID=1265417 RepID=A0AAV8YHZ1_9CUCU|nr:hypothetical protein NQ318_006868 [Aromia moschata]
MDDDTESELIAIPEGHVRHTLQGSVQDSFEEGVSDTCCSVPEKQLAVVRSQEAYISQIVKVASNKRSTWIIGSETSRYDLAITSSRKNRLGSPLNSPIRDDVFTPGLESQLEIPIQERLLPIGQHTRDISPAGRNKVRQALGINPCN